VASGGGSEDPLVRHRLEIRSYSSGEDGTFNLEPKPKITNISTYDVIITSFSFFLSHSRLFSSASLRPERFMDFLKGRIISMPSFLRYRQWQKHRSMQLSYEIYRVINARKISV
jgi:hypothetical protein